MSDPRQPRAPERTPIGRADYAGHAAPWLRHDKRTRHAHREAVAVPNTSVFGAAEVH